jgi:hypothetical protein
MRLPVTSTSAAASTSSPFIVITRAPSSTNEPVGVGREACSAISNVFAVGTLSASSGSAGFAAVFFASSFVGSSFFAAFARSSAANFNASASGSRWKVRPWVQVNDFPPSAQATNAPASRDRRTTGSGPSLIPTSGGSGNCIPGRAATYTLSREANATHAPSGEGASSDSAGSRRWRRLSVPSRRIETRSFLPGSPGLAGGTPSRKNRRVPSALQKACGWKPFGPPGSTAVT